MLAVTATHFSGFQLDGHTYLPAIGLLTVVTGSYMPDIDIHRSKLGQQHKFISKHLTHRGITHTLLIPIILFVVMLMVAAAKIPVLPDLILGFNVGWVVHIIADLCNRKGVPLFWPFYRKRVHIATFLARAFWIGALGIRACAYCPNELHTISPHTSHQIHMPHGFYIKPLHNSLSV